MNCDDNTINDDDTNMNIKNVILSREETGERNWKKNKKRI
jgi:hypothetical protein